MTGQAAESRSTFSALYYPETICLDESELKYLLLLYDRVFFLPIDLQPNPGHTTLRKRFSINDTLLTGGFKSREEAHYSLMYLSEPSSWDGRMHRLMDLYDELEEKKIVVALQDAEFADTTHEHPLKVAVDADMADAEFVQLCIRHQNQKIFIPKNDLDDSKIKGGGFVVRPILYQGELSIPSICAERLNTALFISGRDNLFPVCGQKCMSTC